MPRGWIKSEDGDLVYPFMTTFEKVEFIKEKEFERRYYMEARRFSKSLLFVDLVFPCQQDSETEELTNISEKSHGTNITHTEYKQIQDIYFVELSNNNNLFDNHKNDPIKTYKKWLNTYMTKTDKN